LRGVPLFLAAAHLPVATLLLALDPGAPRLHAEMTLAPPVMDGRVGDEVWRLAPPVELARQQYPSDGKPATERTRVRVLYDDEALYVGFEAEHKRAPVIERLTRRDHDSESEWVSVQIDPRNEGKVALTFSVNVSGVLLDAQVTEPSQWNLDWDENWEAHAARTPDGWSAEFRIPFRVLRFDPKVPVQSWGFQLARYLAQNQEVDLWAYVPLGLGNPLQHLGHLDDVHVPTRGAAIELRPFALASGQRLDTTDVTSASGYDADWSAGLDLKWHLAPDLTLDAAANPDFAQVEADQVILNLTNYETFLPEKRPLFLEGADVFAFPLQLFYSRRIGFVPTPPTLRSETGANEKLVNVPSPATIYGAGKLVGRLGTDWTIGALSAVTARNEVVVEDTVTKVRSTRLVAPLSAFNVLRLRREVGRGYFGAIATGATSFERDGGYPDLMNGTQLCPSGAMPALGAQCFRDSYVAGLDGLWRSPSGDWVANGALLGSAIRGGQAATQLDGVVIGPGARSLGGYARVAKEGGHVLASASYSGAGRTLDYNDLGFMPRQNLHDIKASIGIRTLQPTSLTIDTSTTFEASDRRSLSGLELGQLYSLNGRVKLQNYWTIFLAADAAPARFDDREVGNGIALEHGRYAGGRLELATDPKRRVFVSLNGQAQVIQNGAQAVAAQGQLVLSPVPQFDIALMPQLSWSAGEPRYTGLTEGDPANPAGYVFGSLAATSVGATLRANYTFAPRLTLQAYAQMYLAAGRFSDRRSVAAVPGQRVHLTDFAASPAAMMVPAASTPDFEEAALNLNVVFRWEYRLGSTFFVVYSRSQVPQIANALEPVSLQPSALGRRSSADVILLKLSYWWSS
jgi:hypothetical protein